MTFSSIAGWLLDQAYRQRFGNSKARLTRVEEGRGVVLTRDLDRSCAIKSAQDGDILLGCLRVPLRAGGGS